MEEQKRFKIAWISLTHACNNRCIWCYANSGDSRKKVFFPVEKEDGILDLIKSLGCQTVVLVGGEPTLYPTLPGIVKKIKTRGMKCGLVTNGKKLTEESLVKNLSSSGIDNIVISIEAANPDAHDRITRVKGSFYETVKGMEGCLKYGIKTATNTVISKSTMSFIDDLVKFLSNFEIIGASFNVNSPCLSEEENNLDLLDPRIAVKTFERAYLLGKDMGLKTRLVTPVPICFFSAELREELIATRSLGISPCHIVSGGNISIECNGDVLPCTHYVGFPIMNVFQGTYNAKSFVEELENKGSHFRQRVNRYASKVCESCNEPCSGGCSILWTKYKPSEMIKGK